MLEKDPRCRCVLRPSASWRAPSCDGQLAPGPPWPSNMLKTKPAVQLIENHVVSLSLAIRQITFRFKKVFPPNSFCPNTELRGGKGSVPANHRTLHGSPKHSTHSKNLKCLECSQCVVRKVAHSYSEGQKLGSLVLDCSSVFLPQYRA